MLHYLIAISICSIIFLLIIHIFVRMLTYNHVGTCEYDITDAINRNNDQHQKIHSQLCEVLNMIKQVSRNRYKHIH